MPAQIWGVSLPSQSHWHTGEGRSHRLSCPLTPATLSLSSCVPTNSCSSQTLKHEAATFHCSGSRNIWSLCPHTQGKLSFSKVDQEQFPPFEHTQRQGGGCSPGDVRVMLDLRTAPGCKILLKHKQPVPTHQAQILCPQSRALSTVPLLRYKVSESRGPADRSHIWAANLPDLHSKSKIRCAGSSFCCLATRLALPTGLHLAMLGVMPCTRGSALAVLPACWHCTASSEQV